jgi:hypothetical protein
MKVQEVKGHEPHQVRGKGNLLTSSLTMGRKESDPKVRFWAEFREEGLAHLSKLE